MIKTDHGPAYSLISSASTSRRTAARSMRLLKDVVVGDFTLEAKVQSTTKDYPHRDMCLFFGYQDPAHFYYVHLGQEGRRPRQPDLHRQRRGPHRRSRPRPPTARPGTTAGTTSSSSATVSDGTIEVYFDDMKTPVMTAKDKTFTWGQVGVGSFDDTGNFANFKLSGNRAKPNPAKK